jgi:hypothetical protein
VLTDEMGNENVGSYDELDNRVNDARMLRDRYTEMVANAKHRYEQIQLRCGLFVIVLFSYLCKL